MGGPLRGDQWDTLLAGVTLCQSKGINLSFTAEDEPGLGGRVKAIMPGAVIIGRPVFGGNDPTPSSLTPGQWQTGEAWFNRMWPSMQDYTGVDYYQFVNEWEGNGDPPEQVRHFADFYIQLAAACQKHGIKCTMGDWSTGCPGYPTVPAEAHYLPILQDMLSAAEQLGMPINYHCYAPEGAGATDMSAGAPYFFLRWEILALNHPNLKIIGGEGGNAGKGFGGGPEGMFRGLQSLDLMKQAASLIAASPYSANLLAVNWWEVVNGSVHGDWANDDWTSILPQFFDWSANS